MGLLHEDTDDVMVYILQSNKLDKYHHLITSYVNHVIRYMVNPNIIDACEFLSYSPRRNTQLVREEVFLRAECSTRGSQPYVTYMSFRFV